jgi:hypothetical protein
VDPENFCDTIDESAKIINTRFQIDAFVFNTRAKLGAYIFHMREGQAVSIFKSFMQKDTF